MSTLPYPMRDSVTMLRRDLRHSVRFPMMTLSTVGMPVLFLLLFAGVFGATLGAGLERAVGADGHYIDYITPGIILMTICAGVEVTAVNVSADKTEGIITRFRTMAITRTSVLTGQVLGSLLRTLISGVLVIAVAVALGFHLTTDPLAWLAAGAVFSMATIALTWLGVSFGLFAKTPAGANSLALILVVLPFISSAFVPTTSMPAGVRQFAEYQPFTPIIETLRSLLMGTSPGHNGLLAIAWCVAIGFLGYLWARALYARNPAR